MSGKVAFALMTVFRDTHILSSTYGILALFYAKFRLDPVNRQFKAQRTNQFWVSDFT